MLSMLGPAGAGGGVVGGFVGPLRWAPMMDVRMDRGLGGELVKGFRRLMGGDGAGGEGC